MAEDEDHILKIINWVERANSFFIYLHDRFCQDDFKNSAFNYLVEKRMVSNFDYFFLENRRPLVTSMEEVFDFKLCYSLMEFYLFGSKKIRLSYVSKKRDFCSAIEFYAYDEMLQAIFEFRRAAESFPKFAEIFYHCTPLYQLDNGDLMFLEKQIEANQQPVSLFLHETQELVRLSPDFWSFLVEWEKSLYLPLDYWQEYLDEKTGYFSADKIDSSRFEQIKDFRPSEITTRVPRRGLGR